MGRFGRLFFASAFASALCLPSSPCLSQGQRAPAAPARSIANGEFRAGILRRHPNYNNYRETDVSTLNIAEVRGLLGVISVKQNGYQSLIPQSYLREFGADATAKFMQALAFDAARRGEPALYASAILNGGLSGENDRSNGAAAVNSNIAVNLPVKSAAGQTMVRTTAPEALNFAVASTAIAAANDRYTAETISMINGRPSKYQPSLQVDVHVPPDVISAIVAANRGLPRRVANQNFDLPVSDEIAFLAGYASQAGASRNIAPINVPLTQQDFCSAPGIRNKVFRARAPDVDIGEAFHAGAAMRRYDTMNNAEFQRVRAACAN